MTESEYRVPIELVKAEKERDEMRLEKAQEVRELLSEARELLSEASSVAEDAALEDLQIRVDGVKNGLLLASMEYASKVEHEYYQIVNRYWRKKINELEREADA